METKFKKLTEHYEGLLFENYDLTQLMLLKKNGRRIRANENNAIYCLLQSKLMEYGLSLLHQFERNGLTLRGINLLEGFPIENEPILKQLYGFIDFTAHIGLRGFDSFAVAFDYNVDTGKCELQRHSWGLITDRIDFDTLSEMLRHLEVHGYENAFNVNK